MIERLEGCGINSTTNAIAEMAERETRVMIQTENPFFLTFSNSGNSDVNSTTNGFVHSGRHRANNGPNT